MTASQQAHLAIQIPGDLHGVYYNYLVTNNGVTHEAVDPMLRLAVLMVSGYVIDLSQNQSTKVGNSCLDQD